MTVLVGWLGYRPYLGVGFLKQHKTWPLKIYEWNLMNLLYHFLILADDLSEVMKSDGLTNIMCNKSGFMIKAMSKQLYIKPSS